MFMIMGWLHYLYVPLLMSFMPSDIDTDSEDTKNLVNSNDKTSTDSNFSVFKLVTDRLIMLSSIACFFGFFTLSYPEPLLSFRVAEFTESVFIQGFMYFLLLAGMIVMALSFSYLNKLMNPINMVALGLLLSGVSNLVVGPSNLLPDNIVLMGFGLFFSGLTLMLCIVPQLPIMLHQAKIRIIMVPLEKDKKITDI